jgi:hypothetical protein
MEYIEMDSFKVFDQRIAALHGLSGMGGGVMDIRHKEFMAMADAFLGPRFDRVKLAQVEALQLALHEAQADLRKTLDSHEIVRSRYVDDLNKLHISIALQCEAILGASDFIKLFGATPREIGSYIDKEAFLAQA